MRGCWEAPSPAHAVQPAPVRIHPRRETSATTGRLDFVPVGPLPRIRARRVVRSRKGVASAGAPDPLLGFWGEES